MKRTYQLLIFVVTIFYGIFLSSLETGAEIVQNNDGSITITQQDIINKMKVDGKAKLVAGGNGVSTPKYQLTQAIDGVAKVGQVGVVYLEDRLSTKDSFTFVGSMESYNPYIRSSTNLWGLGDGQSFIFHGDDTKNYGDVGSGLGVIDLKNARGLVFDVFYNDKLSSGKWQLGESLKDPFNESSVYFQGWSTDKYGKGKRETTAASYNKFTYGKQGEKKVVMVYDATTRIMTFTVSFSDKTNTHRLTIPESQEYVYFSSTASTGEASSSFFTSVDSIRYTPYRRKTIKYIDEDSKKELYEETKEVKLNETYSFKPKDIPGYDIREIEGKLEGTVDYEENLEDEFVNVYVRKQATDYSYDLVELNSRSIKRTVNNKGDFLSIDTNELKVPKLTKSVSKITITTPPSVVKETVNTILPKGWEQSNYQTNTKNVYQIYNSHYDNVFSEQGNLLTEFDIKSTIRFLGRFQIMNPELDLDETDFKIELSNYPIPIYENRTESEKIGYEFPRINNVGFKEIPAVISNTFNPLIPSNTEFLTYRGINAEATSEIEDNEFIREALGYNAAATTNQQLIKGPFYKETEVLNYLVKYNLNQPLKGQNEMKDIPSLSIPQPVTLIIKNIYGKELSKNELNGSYVINDVVYNNVTNLPVIEGYHFLEMEKSEFPIKVTNKKQEIVVIYEADQLYWGDVPWEFNETNGELTFIDGGKLGESGSSPWNRPDRYQIKSNEIKTISFKETVKAPINSNFLFDSLSNVSKINNLNKLDTSDVVSAYSMFRMMETIETLDVSSFDTQKMTNMEYMFSYMSKLKELDLTSFNTSNEKIEMNYMFYDSTQLKKITLNDKTVLKDTKLINPKGASYTGNWQSIGEGSANIPLGDFVGKSDKLEEHTQKSPEKETYVWEPIYEVGLEISYLQTKTDKPIIEDLNNGNRIDTKSIQVLHKHKSIGDVLENNSIDINPDYEGYKLLTEDIVIKGLSSNKTFTLDSKMPKEDIEVTFYFDPMVHFSYPENIDFGNRPKSKYENIYNMKPSDIETENYLSIIDTIENSQDEPNWTLSMYTTGFYHADSGVRLLADLMLTLPNQKEPIMITSEGVPIVENSHDFKKDIHLSSNKNNEGLAVRVAKVDKLGQYNGILKYQLQIVP